MVIERTGAATVHGFPAVEELFLLVAPQPKQPYRFEARIGARLLCITTEPFCEAARILLSEGVNPAAVLTMRHFSSDTVALRGSIARVARLTITDDPQGRPRFREWKPSPFAKEAA
jgi:hypothetical protein